MRGLANDSKMGISTRLERVAFYVFLLADTLLSAKQKKPILTKEIKLNDVG